MVYSFFNIWIICMQNLYHLFGGNLHSIFSIVRDFIYSKCVGDFNQALKRLLSNLSILTHFHDLNWISSPLWPRTLCRNRLLCGLDLSKRKHLEQWVKKEGPRQRKSVWNLKTGTERKTRAMKGDTSRNVFSDPGSTIAPTCRGIRSHPWGGCMHSGAFARMEICPVC